MVEKSWGGEGGRTDAVEHLTSTGSIVLAESASSEALEEEIGVRFVVQPALRLKNVGKRGKTRRADGRGITG